MAATEYLRNPTASIRLAVGVAWGLFAVSIWAGWLVMTRLDLLSSGLNLFDITAIRFATAAAVLAPVAWRHGILAPSVGPLGTAVLASGSGAPYALIAGAGLMYAPASHAGPLLPGAMPLFAAVLSAVFLREHITRSRVLGLALIPIGALLVAGANLLEPVGQRWIGHLLLIAAAFCWASYAVAVRRAGLSALQTAALVASWSAITYLPIYLIALPKQIHSASWVALFQQIVFQGLLTSVVSLVAFNRAVAILGASRAAVLAALVPALATLLAIPVLGERPTPSEISGALIVSCGVLIGSGALDLPRSRRPQPANASGS